MAPKPVYVASDVHLGAAPPRFEAAFLAWLASAAERASQVLINGDLFDFWFEYRRGIPKGHERILGLLADVVRGGLPVTLMGGNHDWWGGSYLRDEIGVEFLQDPLVREYAGLRTYVAHGDGLGKGDLKYLALRAVLRGRWTRAAFGLLPPSLGAQVAARVSRTGHRQGEPSTAQRDRARALEAWAVAKLGQEPELDLILLGHTHAPMIREVERGRWYVNAGDWVQHCTYVVLEQGEPPRLLSWEA
jgi:UDP-2,3-diacylglucosamine hydrolase